MKYGIFTHTVVDTLTNFNTKIIYFFAHLNDKYTLKSIPSECIRQVFRKMVNFARNFFRKFISPESRRPPDSGVWIENRIRNMIVDDYHSIEIKKLPHF